MNNKRFTSISANTILIFALALLAGNLVFAFASRASAEGDDADSTGVIAAEGRTAFTYQGSLENNGVPVNGACDMQFRLYDADSGGSQVGSTLTYTNVAVSDSVFTVELDFGNQFPGDLRFLQIAVRCPAGSGSYSDMGRVALTATPYALSLRPGAVISGSVSSGLGNGLTVVNDGGNGGIYGGNVIRDVFVLPAGGFGVRGDSQNGTGVWGVSSGGAGVDGYSDTSIGVNGFSSNHIGVYGYSGNGNSYGVYADGNAHVEGNLTWKPVTSYLSIPAAALQPNDESLSWDVSYGGLYFYSNVDTYYVVPVSLPHNATVTEIKTWWTDASAGDAELILRRTMPGVDWSDMTALYTSGSAGTMLESSNNNIADPVIDNSQYAYFLLIGLPDSSINYYQTVIKYTINQPY